MSARQYLDTITSVSQPPSAIVGDEWFNPATNKLYKFIAAFGQAPIWVEIPSSASGVTTISNLAVTGGTGSFSGGPSNLAVSLTNVGEMVTVSTAPSTITNFDITSQSIMYFIGNATGNWTVNFRGSSTVPLNNVLAPGQSITAVLMATNGSTAYLSSAVTIDGVSVTPKYQGGTAPTSGNASSIDIYSYTIIKTASSTYTVLCSQVKFA